MKILLLAVPPHPDAKKLAFKLAPPLNIYLLAGVLRSAGYNADVCDPAILETCMIDGHWNEEAVDNLVSGYDAVGISINCVTWGMAKSFIDLVKRRRESPSIVCGGIYPSFFPECVLNKTNADMVIRGDGEIPLLALMDALTGKGELKDVPNLSYRDNGRQVHNPMTTGECLKDYGVPAYDLMPQNVYYNLPVETSRGCPFHCSFCSIFYKKQWRGLSARETLRRVDSAQRHLNEKIKSKAILFTDDIFTGNPSRAIEIFKGFKKIDTEFKINFEARITDFLKNDPLIDALAEIEDKVSTIQIGVECGYDDGLLEIKKGFTIKDIEEGLDKLQKRNLSKKVFLSFIIGFPWETYTDCVKTIEYALELEDKYALALFVYWWLPLKSNLSDNLNKYGFNFHADIYDDPLWVRDQKILQAVHPRLSMAERKKITDKYKGIVINLFDH
ncbi:MAG: B12-binding domain-containing radical SAM protein [Spirochaetales bacterium]|nr:B12-binding domain-containing radical SAM protein [Spirochaetales bacterium]